MDPSARQFYIFPSSLNDLHLNRQNIQQSERVNRDNESFGFQMVWNGWLGGAS
jgi:hypothetical protein